MPRLTLIENQPEEVGAAIDVIGNAARTEILRRLSLETMTAPELAETLGLSRFSVLRHLVALERLSLVAADQPAGARKGITVHWTTDAERVTRVGSKWTRYATGR